MRGTVIGRMCDWNFEGALVLDKTALWESHLFPLRSERALSGDGHEERKTKSNDEQTYPALLHVITVRGTRTTKAQRQPPRSASADGSAATSCSDSQGPP